MDTPQHLDDLRRQAEEKLDAMMSSLPEKSAENVQDLLHDLHVHQIELTLQNEELRHTQAELEASHAQYVDLYSKYANLYDFAPVGYCTLDESGTILEMNLTAAKQWGFQRTDALHTRMYQYILADDRDTLFRHLRAAFNTGTCQTCELRLRNQDGTLFWAQLESSVIQPGSEGFSVPSQGQGGRERVNTLPQAANVLTTTYCLTTITDISDLKQTEELLKRVLGEKNMLMKEILHRTKNNMGAIISLLHLLSSRHQENALMMAVFQEIERRIHAMLVVQQKLYQSGDYAHIDLKDYLDELIPTMFHNLQVSTVRLRLDTETVLVSPDAAIACGLLLNELLTNALKYAFPQNRAGQPDVPPEIQVTLERVDVKTIELRFSDNGVGLPKDFDLERLKSLGLTLVTGFIQQLRGTFEVNSDHGTHWYIRFPQRS